MNKTSTQQEKNLAFRAKLLANETGHMSNSMPLKQPPRTLMEKIMKAQRASIASRDIKIDDESLDNVSTRPVKFEMREKLQLSL